MNGNILALKLKVKLIAGFLSQTGIKEEKFYLHFSITFPATDGEILWRKYQQNKISLILLQLIPGLTTFNSSHSRIYSFRSWVEILTKPQQ